jgi:chemotaxis protein MotB
MGIRYSVIWDNSIPIIKFSFMKNLAFLLVVILSATFVSCGPSRKLRTAMAEVQRLDSTKMALTAQIGELQKNVADLTQKNNALTQTINGLNQKNNELSSSLGSANSNNLTQQQKLEALQKSLQNQKSSMEELRSKIANALNKFKSDEIQVTYKDGLVYVSMQDKLLFKTGSASLDKRGKEALGSVATVLNQNPDIRVMVVGNTDSIPIRSTFKDNWSLSTERANTIVRILNDSYLVEPARLTAAGRSKYSPVSDNSTIEGRAQNRRTDLVLTPDLSKVWDLVNNTSGQ